MKGLDVDGKVIDSDFEQDQEDVMDRFERLLAQARERFGIPEIPQPQNKLEQSLTDIDISSLPNKELSALHAQYVAWASYVRTKFTEVQAIEKLAKENLQKVVAQVKRELYAEGVPQAQVTAFVKTHPQYERYQIEHDKYWFMKNILESHYKAYDGMARALSRDVEIRKLEYEHQLRSHSIAVHKPRGPSSPKKKRGSS